MHHTLKAPLATNESKKIDLIVLCGLSGAGKTVAARALEDIGYYCIDRLPATLLASTLKVLKEQGVDKIAIGLEMTDPEFVRNAQSHWDDLEKYNFSVRVMLLSCKQEVLVRRYHETRRPHPLSKLGLSTESAIALEVRNMRNVPRGTYVIDTTNMSSLALTKFVQHCVQEPEASQLTVVLQSFGFKHGVPNDMDMMFDARCLPNPYYEPTLRPFTGQDQNVMDFFAKNPIVHEFGQHIAQFLTTWRATYEADHRRCLNVGIGCTGGQHRSVFLVEMLGKCSALGNVKMRHRDAHHWPAK